MTLQDYFAAHPKAALAFSGGVDSAYLLYAGLHAGADVRPYYVKTQFQPAFEFRDAMRLCEKLGVEPRVLPLDALHGFVLFPFKHFYLRIRVLVHAVAKPLRSRRRVRGMTLLWSGLALAAAAGLCALAIRLLSDAETGFGKLMAGVADWFRWDLELGDWFGRFLLSLPVGQYLFGLIAGALFGNSAWVGWSAYVVGIAAIVISGIILKKTKMFIITSPIIKIITVKLIRKQNPKQMRK